MANEMCAVVNCFSKEATSYVAGYLANSNIEIESYVCDECYQLSRN